jgi:hypothetical protein
MPPNYPIQHPQAPNYPMQCANGPQQFSQMPVNVPPPNQPNQIPGAMQFFGNPPPVGMPQGQPGVPNMGRQPPQMVVFPNSNASSGMNVRHRHQFSPTQLRYLLQAYNVGMLALETLARRVHDDRPQAKYGKSKFNDAKSDSHSTLFYLNSSKPAIRRRCQVALKDLKASRNAVSPSVLHLCSQLHRQSIHTARGGHRISALLGAKQLKQLGFGDATFALGFAALGAKVSANVSQHII